MIQFTVTIREEVAPRRGLNLDCEGKCNSDDEQATALESDFAKIFAPCLHELVNVLAKEYNGGKSPQEVIPKTIITRKVEQCHECLKRATVKVGDKWVCDDHREGA